MMTKFIPSTSLVVCSTSLALLISLAPAAEAQTFPNPVQTGATAGIVRHSDDAAGHVIGRAADGVDELVNVTKDAIVGKTPSTDLFAGLREGSQVLVQYDATTRAEKAAPEIVRISDNGDRGRDMIQGRVTQINRRKQELVIALEDGSQQKLHLTERAAAQSDEMTGDSAKVVVYYTNDEGDRIVQFFRQIR